MSEKTKKVKSLVEKLHTIQSSLEYMKKDGKGNSGLYVTPAKMFQSIKELMDAEKVILDPIIEKTTLEIVLNPTAKTPNNHEYCVSLSMRMRWVNVEDPDDTREVKWFSAGKNPNDPAMAVGSALTYGKRYFFGSYFSIPMGEQDPEEFKTETAKKMTTEHVGQISQQIASYWQTEDTQLISKNWVAGKFGANCIANMKDSDFEGAKIEIQNLIEKLKAEAVANAAKV